MKIILLNKCFSFILALAVVFPARIRETLNHKNISDLGQAIWTVANGRNNMV